MKRRPLGVLIMAAATITAGSGAVFAADSTAFSSGVISDGTSGSPGYISVESYADGWVGGGADYVATGASSAAGTIWRNEFMVLDESTDNAFHTGDGDTPVSGLQGFSPSNFNNDTSANENTSDLALSGTLSGQLTVGVQQSGQADDRSTIEWTWVIDNSDTSNSVPIRLVWFADVDSELGGTSFSDDLVAASLDVDGYTELSSRPVLVQGEDDGSGSIDLNNGAVMDVAVSGSTVDEFSFHGFQPSGGPSNFWNGEGDFTSGNIEDTQGIPSALQNNITGDGNGDFLVDATGDCGMIMSFDTEVPSSGSVTFTCVLTYGVDDTVSGGEFTANVENWNLY